MRNGGGRRLRRQRDDAHISRLLAERAAKVNAPRAPCPCCASAAPGAKTMAAPQQFELITGDLSFILLTLVLPRWCRCWRRKASC